ncbi:Pentatricopeptide repeat-containing protein, mitochondrial [Senna tora]|uniref:Pentatricopeptide repeat-containing protein, mitochondrial n=1 Tax=Senna tora TaxID=362788 RepID=A0A834WWX2_9FABA|nr:Pentatricopeptide repeat-containing protein, mitochondrial [Senna tora]
MCASKARNLCTLSALFRSTLKPNTCKLETSSLPSSISESEDDFSELDEPMFSSRHLLGLARASGSENSPKLVSKQISSILCENPHNQLSGHISSMLNDNQLVKRPDNDVKNQHSVLDLPWYPTMSHGNILQRQKEASRTRKQKWIFHTTQQNRFQRVVNFSAEKLGTDTVLEVFGRLGKETTLEDYNALIGLCIKKARATNDEEVAVGEMGKAFHLFTLMREHGHQLQEQTYGPFLVYLIDMGMVEEFEFFSEVIKDENPSSLSRLGYYEMMLWLRVEDEEKIWERCKSIVVTGGEDPSGFGGRKI